MGVDACTPQSSELPFAYPQQQQLTAVEKQTMPMTNRRCPGQSNEIYVGLLSISKH